MTRYALFSLDDPTGCETLARAACEAGLELLASSETVAYLADFGIAVQDLRDFTGLDQDFGFPPSLHPRIELALTGDGPARIELVFVLPYGLDKGLDIGGRTLLGLGLKGKRLTVCNRADRDDLARALASSPKPSQELFDRLAAHTACELASFYAELAKTHEGLAAAVWQREYPLAEGENPYQIPAALFSSQDHDPLGLPAFTRRSGQPPCFTNLADADAVLVTLTLAHRAFAAHFGRAPFLCVAAKHGTACGLGMDWEDPRKAIAKALFGSAVAVWGGEAAVNFAVNAGEAQSLFADAARETLLGDAHWMLDVILAPEFSDEAVAILGKRAQRKLLANPRLREPELPSGPSVRQVRGGVLIQPQGNYVLDLRAAEHEGSAPGQGLVQDLILAWAVAWSAASGGNEVALAKEGRLLSVGGGPSTVEAALVAAQRAKRAGHDTTGAVFAADAFFPFTDAPAILAQAGCTAGLVPAGGRRESEVRAFFAAHNVDMFYVPEDKRGFCRH